MTNGMCSQWPRQEELDKLLSLSRLRLKIVDFDIVLARRPAGVDAESQRDDENGKGESDDADDAGPNVALVRVADDRLLHDRRRIAPDSRHAHRRRQVDGLLSGWKRSSHGGGDGYRAGSEWVGAAT